MVVHKKHYVPLFIMCALLWGNSAQEETTTEDFLTEIDSIKDSSAQYVDDYNDEELNATQSPSRDNNPVYDDYGGNSGAEGGELLLPSWKKCTCGVSNSNTRIVNGTEARLGAFPWMAATVYADPDDANTPSNRFQGFCGGSIINDRYILTAAHCTPVMKELGLSNFKVIVGDTNINGVPSPTRKVLDIAAVTSHPKYDSQNFGYDVAVVKLSTTLTYNNNIRPICLGQAGSPFTGRNVTVAGWGLIQGGSKDIISNSLRQTSLKVVPSSECVRIYGNDFSAKLMICAYNAGTIACNGDSGGPLILRWKFSQIYTQIGIVSYGEAGCIGNTPDAYTRVKRVMAFVRGATRDANYCWNSFSI